MKVNRNGEEKNRGKLIGFYLVTMSSECLSRQNTPFNRKSSARTPLQAQPPLLLSPLQRPSGKSCMYLLPECSPLSLSLSLEPGCVPRGTVLAKLGRPPAPDPPPPMPNPKVKSHLSQIHCFYCEFIPAITKHIRMSSHLICGVVQFDTRLYPL